MVGEVLLNKVSPVALGQFAGEAVEVKIKLLRLPA
jgi:hypothetical protein